MRADIHDGPEHNTLQAEAGYIDARSLAAISSKSSCNARPDHTYGSNSTVRLHLWDGSLPLDSFRAVRVPATESVGQLRKSRLFSAGHHWWYITRTHCRE